MKKLTREQYQLYGKLLTDFPDSGDLIVSTMRKNPQDYDSLRTRLEYLRAQAQERVQRLAVVDRVTMADRFMNTAGTSDGRENRPDATKQVDGPSNGQLYR